MRPWLSKLWNDPNYLYKTIILIAGFALTVIPLLPLDDTAGTIGYWVKQFGMPLLVAFSATTRGSGLTEDEAAKLRALIPTQEVLDKKAPVGL